MLLTIISFIIILSLLIFVHEFGHFITAKKSGMKVEEFGFGFPPRLWGAKKGETVYSINWIPLGGFVKIKGEDGGGREETDSFSHKPFGQKSLVLSAGVLMNVVFAYLLISVGLMIGLPTAVDTNDLAKNQISNVRVQIAGVVEDSPAKAAGLKMGDYILSLDGQEIKSVQQLKEYVSQNPESEISLGYVRGKQEPAEIKFTPRVMEGFSPEKVLGVNLIQTGLVRYGFFESWYQGLIAAFNLLVAIVMAFYGLFKNLFTGQGLSEAVAGPVGVAALTVQMVELGFSYVLRFTAILSINLAVLNFLPFPALDGGRFVGVLIEKIRRKPNNLKVETIIHNTGFALLMLLVIFITYRDISRYSFGLLEKIKDLF